MPKRIKRKRTSGWKMPKGCVCCTRPGKYGNPFQIGLPGPLGRMAMDKKGAVGFFEAMLDDPQLRAAAGYPSDEEIRRDLGGKDLACWCALDDLCHVDILLKRANP